MEIRPDMSSHYSDYLKARREVEKIQNLDVDRPSEKEIAYLRMRRELEDSASRQELYAMGIDDTEIMRRTAERLQEIMDYTGEPIAAIKDKIIRSIQQAFDLWDELKPSDESTLAKFHSSTSRKIYSLSATCDYLAVVREKIISRILQRGASKARMLDFGASHGHISIAAAKAGLDVTYADIGLTVRSYAQWRAEREGLSITFAPIANNRCCLSGTYDYIVCLDCVSHLPNLPIYINEFRDRLNNGGEFFLGDDLFDFCAPYHLRENMVYRDIIRKRELLKDFRLVEHIWANCDAYRKDVRHA